MTNPSSSSHIESFSTTRPPFVKGTDYSYWKGKMSWFLKSINLYSFCSFYADLSVERVEKNEYDEKNKNNKII